MVNSSGIFNAEGTGHARIIAEESANGKKVDLTLIWLTVVKEKTVSPPLFVKRIVSTIAPGHNQRRDPFGDD
jgi:hypothetical protein